MKSPRKFMFVPARKRSAKPLPPGTNTARRNSLISGACRYVLLSSLATVGFCGGGSPRKAVAGDLLRGGYRSGNVSGSTAPGSFTPPSEVQARKSANDLMARTTQTVTALRSMQSAARGIAAAAASSVPNGLVVNGLVPTQGITPLTGGGFSVSGWTGVGSLNQSVAGSKTTVTVVQNAADAFLNWSSFNVGKNTTLAFNQDAGGQQEGNWIAFNMVSGNSTSPAQILGSIKAGGQVYVIDQNGIIFGGSSVVNVHTLVASSLPINTFLSGPNPANAAHGSVGNGVLNSPDNQFLFSALAQAAGKNSPAFTPPPAPVGGYGDVTVEAGATLTAPASTASVGGRIALIGPNVTNNGSIYTPDGQTILAAGMQVGFGISSDATLRGLDVYIGAVPNTATEGLAVNNGSIEAPGGDTFIAGANIQQNGVLANVTTATLNGRIDLNASYNAVSAGDATVTPFPYDPTATGTVLLGQDSVTRILPDYSSAETVTDGQFFNANGTPATPTEVNVTGRAIHMEGDSTIFAPSAIINLNAGTWSENITGTSIKDVFANSAPSQIYLDSGAVINAEGSWDISAPVSQNIVPVQLLGPQFENDPLQRNGVFRGTTIYVDIRNTGYYDGVYYQGTALGDTSGYVGLIPYTVGELTTAGGTVNLNAGGSIVMQPGSEVNVSGGWVDYQGGTVMMSQVISDGHVYPISAATPNLVYQGFNLGTFTVDQLRYGISKTYTDPLITNSYYENSYVQGFSGGKLNITAPATALDGQFLGLTVNGPRQLPQSYNDMSTALQPSLTPGSQFNLTYQAEVGSNGSAGIQPPPISPTVIFAPANNSTPVGAFAENSAGVPSEYTGPLADPGNPSDPLNAEVSANGISLARQKTVILSPDLVGSDGFASININNPDGNFTLPAGVSLTTQPLGSITVTGASINIQGSITAPGGTLSFTAYDEDPGFPLDEVPVSPTYDPTRGLLTVGPSATLDTSGLVLDDREGVPGADTRPVVTKGGKVTLSSLVLNLDSGSTINVSGGVEMQTSGKPAYGAGGSISLLGGIDPYIDSVPDGALKLDATLLGYSGAAGGALTIQAPLIQVGGVTSNPSTLLLAPEFFDQGGFSSFTLAGAGGFGKGPGDFLPGIVIAPGTHINPVITTSVVIPDRFGDDLAMEEELLPVGVRSPVSLAFNAIGVSDPNNSASTSLVIRGDLVMGAGSVIQTDPLGNVSFSGQTAAILGSVYAPGGNITVSGANDSKILELDHNSSAENLITVDIGPDSVLSTAGTPLLIQKIINEVTFETGKVLDGGRITVSGNILAEGGSVLDVSGATGIVDLSPYDTSFTGQSALNTAPVGLQNGTLFGSPLVPTRVYSNGGTITFNGGQSLYSDATLLGEPGGPSASGGSLIISAAQGLPTLPSLVITQSAPSIPYADFYKGSLNAIGFVVADSHGNAVADTLSANEFMAGGFNSITLGGAVQFSGNVDLQAPGSLIVGTEGVILADGKVTLQAPYVAIGQGFQPPGYAKPGQLVYDDGKVAPEYGTGELTVIANLIDIGNLNLQGIGKANFIADGGDIRGDGTLDVAGEVNMTAGQIYPPTESVFNIAAYDVDGSVSVAASSVNSTSVTLASSALPVGFGVGSELLGSTVQSVNGTAVTLTSDANTTIAAATSENFVLPGTVNIVGSGTRETPLSAGGQINVYATNINQDGVLRAPGGIINLGWNGSGANAPTDPFSGQNFDASQKIVLSKGSVTSVSMIDSLTGEPLIIPYGINYNGTEWIDPSSNDITTGGIKAKQVNITGANVVDAKGATIDISGGGDLMAYRFVPGILGGNDILSETISPNSYAVIPGYDAQYTPYAPFNTSNTVNNSGFFGSDPGYVNDHLSGSLTGQQVYLSGEGSLQAGTYTLLPARYALLPGAFLVTALSSAPVGDYTEPDGSYLVSGYQFNALQNGRTAAPLYTSFQVDTSTVLAQRGQYDISLANQFLANGAAAAGNTVPRLPQDAGQLMFNASQSLTAEGSLQAQAGPGGLGGLVDISSPAAIVIMGPGATAPTSGLVLDSSVLDAFGAASLLIGGTRNITGNDATVNVATSSITVDNNGAPLTGQDIILVSKGNITIDQGSEIDASGASGGTEAITIAGNGTLLRVSSDSSAKTTRTGVTAGSQAELAVGAPGGSATDPTRISGASVTLDSSGGAYIDPSAEIKAGSVALNSSNITLDLTDAGTNAPTPSLTPSAGLVLSGNALSTLFGSVHSLSLFSYGTSISIYGTGDIGNVVNGAATLKDLSLNASEILGYNSASGEVTLNAQNITLGYAGTAPVLTPTTATGGGILTLNGDTVALGAGQVDIAQFSGVDLVAANEVIATGAGTLSVVAPLSITAPMITGASGANENILSVGDISIAAPATPSSGAVASSNGLGATLNFVGATIEDNGGTISLPTGKLTLQAQTGDLQIGNGATLEAEGQARSFFGNLTEYTNGGQINLVAKDGNVSVDTGATISVSAQSGGGNAGTLSISAPNANGIANEGMVTLDGDIEGSAPKGETGNFILDVYSLPSLAALDGVLNTGVFDQSRSIEVQTGDVAVDGVGSQQATATTFSLVADGGDINVSGEISDVPNGAPIAETGGSISLQAEGSVNLLGTAVLTVAAQKYNNAGQGGSVDLEAGSDVNGVANQSASVNINAGSTIDLSVAATQQDGDLSGTLHLRAPQIGTPDTPVGVGIGAIAGNITGASSVTIEGYTIFDASADGSIDNQKGSVYDNGTAFVDTVTGSVNANVAANNAALSNAISSGATALVVEPGAEIINTNGDLTLQDTWDLSTYRFGSSGNIAGDLTLRAAGNVIFKYAPQNSASLSDGFADPTNAADLLPAGSASWSYRITAGANFSSAGYASVDSFAEGATSGSVLIGQGAPNMLSTLKGLSTPLIDEAVDEFYQTIRTGNGSISIAAGNDVQLLNNLVTVYTAGTQSPDMNFTPPDTSAATALGGQYSVNPYLPQYSYEGGNVFISAGNDIEHAAASKNGLTMDSSLEMPSNWLYKSGEGNGAYSSWWVDYSNFFEGVGALGGGNVSLVAGGSVINVDALLPTNRLPIAPTSNAAATDAAVLGGGDLLVQAGGNINGGVYYVERGNGTLDAGGSILTNATRADTAPTSVLGIPPQNSWLPTTLFLGTGNLGINAGGSILLSSIANPFLLPDGVGQGAINRTYFSTFGLDDTVDISSLSGSVTIKSFSSSADGTLENWYENVLLFGSGKATYAALYEPWLQLDEPGTTLTQYASLFTLLPASVSVTALSGDINLQGQVAISPSASGGLDLAAYGSIKAFQPVNSALQYSSGVIDVSDADPSLVPDFTSTINVPGRSSSTIPLAPVNALFADSGSTEGQYGVLQTQEALHDQSLLHATDIKPIDVYAENGSISGLTLYSPEVTQMVAGLDITDFSLYVQNDNTSSISVVASGRDIIPYDPNSPLRLEAVASGANLLYGSGGFIPGSESPNAGDIQVAGPGTLEVLAGRNLTLGVGPNDLANGTANGITSIGQAANPALPVVGAQVIAAAGLGAVPVPDGLSNSSLEWQTFDNTVLSSAAGATYFSDLAATDNFNVPNYAAFKQLDAQQQDIIGLDLFYLVIRDAGRDHNLAGSPGYGNYAAGLSAIQALIPGNGTGDMNLTSKEINTESGGDVDVFVPHGQLTVGVELPGSQDQGILTEDGGNISIYTQGDVTVGTSRIFTLRGGNIVIWSNGGSIAAGEASKTVQTAPPTRVLVDPQSGNVETDLQGLATGGGIGVLASIQGVPPGSVDLIAPVGVIDAGDAGIRATGNLNLAATQVLNAANIQAGGATTGVPTVTVAAPNLGALAAASSAAGAGAASATDQTNNQAANQNQQESPDSVISVDVIGYGGGDGDDSGG